MDDDWHDASDPTNGEWTKAQHSDPCSGTLPLPLPLPLASSCKEGVFWLKLPFLFKAVLLTRLDLFVLASLCLL